MSNAKPKSTYKDLLAGIEKLNQQEVSDVYVMSAGKTVPFHPLSVKQQKTILSTGVDTELESLSSTNNINSVIMKNCTDPDLNILITD